MKPFDDILKQKLEGLEVPYEPSHWELMEGRLDESADPTPPLIDLLALQHLEELGADRPAGSWEAFSDKLEASEMAVDQIAREHLEDLEFPYDPDHWPLMRRRLDEAFTLRGIIYRYKLAEIGLMLLLLWTIILYVPGPDISELYRSDSIPTAEAEQDANGPLETSDIPTENEWPASGQPSSVLPETAGSAMLPAAGINPALSGEHTSGAGEGLATALIHIEENQAIPEQGIEALPGISPELGMESEISVLPPFRPINPVASLSLYPEASISAAGIGEAAPVIRRQNTHLRVSMMVGPDYNRIYTPADQVFRTPATYLDSVGYSAGILVDFQRGKWSFQSGAMYVNKSYNPVLPEQQYGTFDFLVVESFEAISLELLQIPLNVRYNFLPQNTRWDFYLTGGFGANLLLKPVYSIRQEQFVSSDYKGKPGEEELRALTSSKSLLNEKQFPEGLFDGGGLSDNSYLTASFGFGLERYLDGRWSLFLQPQLQYQLPFDGFGPNADRFHSLSLRLGTRVIVW